MKLSDTAIAVLACPAGKRDALFFDDGTPGLGLRVTAQGARTFLFQYRVGTTVRRMRLGQWGKDGEGLTLAQARKLAAVQYGLVAGGADPVAGRKAEQAATAAAEAEAKRKQRADAYTLEALINDWDTRHLASMRMSYRRDALSRLRLHLKSLLTTPAGAITRAAVVHFVDTIAAAAGETTARRTIGYARSAYAWAQKRGSVAGNPFEGVPLPGRDVRRDRVLTMGEVAEIWRATPGLPIPYGAFTRVLLLTLQRREEVAGMRWGEVAPDLSTWELPAARAKNAKAHLVHLTEPVRDELRAIRRGKPDEIVFRTPLATVRPDGKPARRGLTAFSHAKRRLDALVAQARQEATEKVGGPPPEPMPAWRLHDFRRTGVTVLAEMGTAPHVADRLLNHVQGTIKGVAAIYQRGEFLAERKRALEAWAAHVLAGAEGKPAGSNVVPLKPAA